MLPKIMSSKLMSSKATTSKTTAEPSAKVNRYPFLDGVRGLAALAVVFFHIAVSEEFPAVEGGIQGFIWNTLFGSGSLGVAVFFVLSGFVISHALRRGLSSPGDFARFMLRRIVRLTPPYWAAVIFAIAFHGLASYTNGEKFAPGGQELSLERLAHHLLYTQEIAGYLNINDVFWTLALELQFYIALGLVVLLVSLAAPSEGRRGFEVAAWILAIGSLAFAFADSDLERATTLPTIFYSFVVGVLINWHWRKAIGIASLALFMVGLTVLGFVSNDVAFTRTALLSGLLLIAALQTGGIRSWLSSAPFEFLGKVSYSLYLVHVPIVGACLVVVTTALGTGLTAYVIGTASAVIASLAASVVFWWCFERPSLEWLASRKRAPNQG